MFAVAHTVRQSLFFFFWSTTAITIASANSADQSPIEIEFLFLNMGNIFKRFQMKEKNKTSKFAVLISYGKNFHNSSSFYIWVAFCLFLL